MTELQKRVEEKAKELYRSSIEPFPKGKTPWYMLSKHVLLFELRARLNERMHATADIQTELDRYKDLERQIKELQG